MYVCMYKPSYVTLKPVIEAVYTSAVHGLSEPVRAEYGIIGSE